MKRVHSLLFIILLLIASSSALFHFPLTPISSGYDVGVSAHGLIDDDGQEAQDDADVDLNMMFFAQAAPNDAGIHYVCRRGMDVIACFGMSRAHYCVDGVWFTLELPGSNDVIPVGENPTGSTTNYLLGNDPSRWRSGLVDCSVVRYREIYPGIDLVYGILDENLKYEFVVEPNADTTVIAVRYSDADTLVVSDDRVCVSKDGREIEDGGLWAFQRNSGLDDVPCAFRAHDARTVAFSVGGYDVSQELVIDPAIFLAYSTFLGGSNYEVGRAIAVEDGFAYVTGNTFSSDFPNASAYGSYLSGSVDCFVTKFAVDGQTLIYSTFLGGSGGEVGRGIAVESGSAYITGETSSSDFPTASAYDSSYNGGTDCFVTKLASDGQSLVYSTFLGGFLYEDLGFAIAVEDGFAYVTGKTWSTEFPIESPFDDDYNGGADCFVTKIAVNGQSLVYSTYLGGTSVDAGSGIAVESGYAYVTGTTESLGFQTFNAFDSIYNGSSDCFVTKFAEDGQTLLYSTFLGGSGGEAAGGIAVYSGLACVTGLTASTDFPTANGYDLSYNGGADCFVAELAADGLSLDYGTFLGGADYDYGYGIAVETGSAFITGVTYSDDFPSANADDSTLNGTSDCFVTKLALGWLPLMYSTFIGGSGDEEALGIAVEDGYVCVTGCTYSSDFATESAYDSSYNDLGDCFVTTLSEDTDSDGLSDWAEAIYGTDPSCIDSDNDNSLDGYEVAYGSNPLDPMSYPPMPQAWYDAIYEDLDGNATLIQYLIMWSEGNSTLLQTVMQQLDDNATLLEQVISWLDGNHTAIETLFTFVDGNATLLIQTVSAVEANSDQLTLLAALVTHNAEALSTLNATHISDIGQIRQIVDMLGATVGDTDYDGLDDLDEIALGTNVQCIDTDCDNLNDAYEVKIGTDPTDDDSDDDTYYDGAEVLAGTDPLDSLDYPGSAGTTTTTTTTTTTQQPMGTELIIIAGAAGCAGLVALLVFFRRRTGARSSS